MLACAVAARTCEIVGPPWLAKATLSPSGAPAANAPAWGSNVPESPLFNQPDTLKIAWLSSRAEASKPAFTISTGAALAAAVTDDHEGQRA